jgi:hypothetical protein
MGDGQKVSLRLQASVFPNLQRFVFRTMVWTKKTNLALRYRTVNNF